MADWCRGVDNLMQAGIPFKMAAGIEDVWFMMNAGPEKKSGLSTEGRKP